VINLSFLVLPEKLSIAQLAPEIPYQPEWQGDPIFHAVIYTPEETTLVCCEDIVPNDAKVEKGWRALKIIQNLDFSIVGVIAEISSHLAQAHISIFVLSTFNTDYILVKQDLLSAAIQSLRQAGYTITEGD
jgi:uncharacterized protein